MPLASASPTPPCQTTSRWHHTFSGAQVGFLELSGIDNTRRETPLNREKDTLAARLLERYAGLTRAEMVDLDILKAYKTYYGRFGNTYHVLGQLESVLRGKALPDVSPLVDAAFLAELETLVLTAAHDADRLEAPLTLDAAQGGETFVSRQGRVRTLKAGDMTLSDARGIVCTILSGQDARTPITPATRRILYVAYAPAGVPQGAVEVQLEMLRRHVACFAPDARLEGQALYTAGNGSC